jgi:hypothetical protein
VTLRMLPWFCWCLMSACCCCDCADKKVFPDFFVLGWYSTGSDVQETDMLIHKAVSTLKPLDEVRNLVH